MTYQTQDRLTGTKIDVFDTREEAEAAIRAYEQEDRDEDNYEPDFYEIKECAAGISIDNGSSYTDPGEAIRTVGWNTIVNAMDDDTREKVHAEIAPCTEEEFLTRYLEIAQDDIVIG